MPDTETRKSLGGVVRTALLRRMDRSIVQNIFYTKNKISSKFEEKKIFGFGKNLIYRIEMN